MNINKKLYPLLCCFFFFFDVGRWYDKMSTLSQKLLLIIFGNYLAYFIHEPKSSLQMKPKRRGCYNWMGNRGAQSFLGCTREKQNLPRTAHSFCNQRGGLPTHILSKPSRQQAHGEAFCSSQPKNWWTERVVQPLTFLLEMHNTQISTPSFGGNLAGAAHWIPEFDIESESLALLVRCMVT